MHNVLMQSTDGRLPEALEHLLRLLRRTATAGNLSMPAAAVLARLVQHGPMRLTELASAEGVSQPAMTQLVTRLERAELARRTTDPSDGRAVVVEVTAAGRRVAQQRRAERAATLHALIAQLDDRDREAIDAALPALVRLAELSNEALPSAGRGAVRLGETA